MSSVDERIAALETQMAALMAENKSLKTKKTKEVKEVKEAKNSTGPSEWNIFVRATWLEMAASAGVLMGEGANAEKEFKAAAKEAGASYQAAMKEASRRRDGNEKPKVDKSAKADKPKVEKPKADKPKEEKAIADVFADLGMCIKVIDEKKYLVCDDGEAFHLTEDGNMGERAGRYDADTDTIDETE
jgi:hypothetical protein